MKFHRLLGVIDTMHFSFDYDYSNRLKYRPFPIFDKYLNFAIKFRNFNATNVLDCRFASGIHHHILKNDSTLAI